MHATSCFDLALSETIRRVRLCWGLYMPVAEAGGSGARRTERYSGLKSREGQTTRFGEVHGQIRRGLGQSGSPARASSSTDINLGNLSTLARIDSCSESERRVSEQRVGGCFSCMFPTYLAWGKIPRTPPPPSSVAVRPPGRDPRYSQTRQSPSAWPPPACWP